LHQSIQCSLGAVIGVTGQNGRGPVDLFQQHDADKLVRPGRGAEGELRRGLVAQRRRQTAIAADDEHRRWAAVVCGVEAATCADAGNRLMPAKPAHNRAMQNGIRTEVS
jgi:hypothetical protein